MNGMRSGPTISTEVARIDMPRRTEAVKPARSCLHRRPSSPSTLMACRARLRRRCVRVFSVVLGGGVALAASGYRGWPRGVGAIELTIDPDMVQNMQSANETAARFSSTDYVDLTCKVCGLLDSSTRPPADRVLTQTEVEFMYRSPMASSPI